MDIVNDAANPTAESVPGPPSTPSAPGDHPRRHRTGSRLHPRVTSFRSRRGALTATQQQSWDRMWPVIGREVADEPLDATGWFGRDAPLVIEIGCGTGTATAAMAQAEPHLNLIGIEVYRPGLAQLVQRIERDGIDNIRLMRGDAVDVLENMVATASLTGVRVFFPDPWPKARHHKRRLLQSTTVALIADRLRPGGVLHVATDHAGYAEHIYRVGQSEPRLARLPQTADRSAAGADETDRDETAPIGFERPVTKFEGKAHRAGSAITELIWEKIDQ